MFSQNFSTTAKYYVFILNHLFQSYKKPLAAGALCIYMFYAEIESGMLASFIDILRILREDNCK